ncbi:MAG: hypothetical protein IJS95_07080 [Prevotella sp.]|nr:hypothetical protein [Prevotella sp.]
MEIQDEWSYYRNIEPDDVIYKVIPLKYIIDMYRHHHILIQNVQKWEDVYENYFLKQNLYVGDTKVDSVDVQQCFYGMSWSRLPESDAMWRIYSPFDKHEEHPENIGVCVSTTARKLLHCFWGKLFDSPAIVGKVEYKSQEDIERYLHQLGILGVHVGEEIRISLFTKREEFRHETEARIIITIPQDIPNKQESYFVDFEPIDLFDCFVLDPRINSNQEAHIRLSLESVGIIDNVYKSLLYTFNPIDIHI